MQLNQPIFIIYFNVVLYATCYQLQRPLEPFMVEKIINSNGADASKEYGNLQSFFQLFQFFGAIIAGLLLDKFGYKVGFVITFLASAMSYYLLSIATSMPILYLSKIPSMFQHGFLCAQMAISVITSAKDQGGKEDGEYRATLLGRLTTCYAIGTVIGPAVGGLLGSTGDYYYGAKLAVIGSLISLILTLGLPAHEIVKAKDENKDKQTENAPADNTISKIWKVLSGVGLLLAAKIISSVANSMNTTVFPLILKNTYNFDEKALGATMSVLSGLNAVVNAFMISPFIVYLGGNLLTVIRVALVAMLIGFFCQGMVCLQFVLQLVSTSNGVVLFMISTIILSAFQYLLATTITAASTCRVDVNSRGTLLGLEHSLFAGARVLAPQLGILVLNGYTDGMAYVSFLASGIYLFVLVSWRTFESSLIGSEKKQT